MDLHVGRDLAAAEVADLLAEARGRTLLLTAALSEADLRLQHDRLMSPIVWDLGHIAHFEDVWLREKMRDGSGDSEGLRGIYNPFENPRALRDELPLPSLPECRAYLADVRRAVIDGLHQIAPGGSTPLLEQGFVFRMVLQHEYQHNETILQTLQLKEGARYQAPRLLTPPLADPEAPPPGAMVRFPGGTVVLGTDDRSVAYDNERPAHRAEVGPFRIGVHPVTNGEYAAFVEAGGYEDATAWTEEGWTWRSEDGARAPKHWERRDDGGWNERFMDRVIELDPRRPVCHVCFWEADAYARWAGKRLPTEREWETAAAWDGSGPGRLFPWGSDAPNPAHANLDALLFETTPVGSYPAGRSALGCWDMLGNVWEWTSSDFEGYPGFTAFPYPEYSEVFFGSEHKVLRGGSWATRFGAIRTTFRNWDYPIRRQIFAGFRCADDD